LLLIAGAQRPLPESVTKYTNRFGQCTTLYIHNRDQRSFNPNPSDIYNNNQGLAVPATAARFGCLIGDTRGGSEQCFQLTDFCPSIKEKC
jgi:hypothetical protein